MDVVARYDTIGRPAHIASTCGKRRVSLILEGLTGMPWVNQRVRLRLDPGMEALEDWNKPVHWITLFEYWIGDGFRITVGLCKPDASPVESLRFRMLFGGWLDIEAFDP